MREIQYIRTLNIQQKLQIYDLTEEVLAGLGIFGLLAAIVCLYLVGANVIKLTGNQELRYIAIATGAACTIVFVYMVFRNYWGREPIGTTHKPKDTSLCLVSAGFLILLPGVVALGVYENEPAPGKFLTVTGLIFITWGILLVTVGLSRNFMEKRIHQRALGKPEVGAYQKLG